MRYPPSLLDEIRSRLPVSRVVERRVKLKRTGREYTGLSPFKTERTPSFTVNDQKGFYHCFASGEHGDIFKFLMQTDGLTFAEAVERLAAEAGVALPAPLPVDKAKVDLEDRLYLVLEECCQFYQAMLRGGEGESARGYLERRGLSHGDITSFRLGLAPDGRSNLKDHLSRKGFSLEEMKDAGLVIHGDDIAVPYDRFRGRLIFPILDAKRRVIAFGGRALSDGQQPKYLNSPETVLFHKGHVLFNMAAAREAARVSKSVFVAEGYMDVIALVKAGFPNAVAPLGTALTPDQLRLLWTMAPAPTLCFDGDAAGQKAAYRAMDGALLHLEPERSLQFAFLPEGRDPDDMVRAGETAALSALLANPVSMIDVIWRREQGRHPLQTPEQRASLEARLMELAAQIEHKSLRYHYISAFRERLRETLRKPFPAAQAAKRFPPSQSRRPKPEPAASRTHSLLASNIAQPSAPSSGAREMLLIAAILRHPWLLDEFAEDVANLHLEDRGCDRLRQALLGLQSEHEHLDNESAMAHLSRAGFDGEIERVERAAAFGAEAQFARNADREQVLEGWSHVFTLHGKAGTPRPVQEAELEYLRDPSIENFQKLSAIKQQCENVAT
jgi:DNA primase